jgi:hypothetical protein
VVASIVANPAGRLITFRVFPPIEDSQSASAAAKLKESIGAIDGRVIICTDVTEAHVFSQETTDLFVKQMRAGNPKIERSAILLGQGSPTFALQLERMVREAASPDRRAFRNTRELEAWLEPLLTPVEQLALHSFLGGAREGS